MSFPADLKHFARGEFLFPDLMDVSFLRWLDRVRAKAGVPIVPTNDARPGDELPSGASPKSLHKRGRAIDFRTKTLTASQKWHIVRAVVELADEAPGKVELETVWSTTDKHWHLGVDDRAEHHEFLESDD
jgi:hypothetical protein